MCVLSNDKFVLKIEISADLVHNVASHHQGVQFFLTTAITSYGDTIEMLSGH